jgi:hypothetical protein
MTIQLGNNQGFPVSEEDLYNFSTPLWDKYFYHTRQHVRFPRNYKEVSALDPI